MDFVTKYLNDLILFAHPTCGVLGMMAAVWVMVEALNPSEASQSRLRIAAWVVAVSMSLAWVLGGYWYVNFYYADKAVILAGPWPFAHNLFMETKEHLFFIPAILALYLPIVAARRLVSDRPARRMVIAVAALIVLTGLAIEGAGAVVNHAAKIAALHADIKGGE